MSREQVKEAVLAKCQEVALKNGNGKLVGDYGHYLSYYQDDPLETSPIGMYRIADSGNTQLCFNTDTYAEWFGWPHIAQILGVVVPTNQPRPSNDLLWEAFSIYAPKEWGIGDVGEFKQIPILDVQGHARDKFTKWLATLPPDPLEADRALVAGDFDYIVAAICGHDPKRQVFKMLDAIKRLCGKGAKDA